MSSSSVLASIECPFLTQFEIFLALGRTCDFFHWNLDMWDIVMRLWILFKPCVLAVFLWHHSGKGKGKIVTLLPHETEWGSPLHLHWHLRERLPSATGQGGSGPHLCLPGWEEQCYCFLCGLYQHHPSGWEVRNSTPRVVATCTGVEVAGFGTTQ